MDIVFQLETTDLFQLVTQEVLSSLHKSGQVSGLEVDSNVIDAAKDYVRKLIVKHNYDMNIVSELIKGSNFDHDRVNYFVSMLNDKKCDIFYSIITHHNCSFADTVTNFDWIIKYVFGTSECKNLKYPLVQMILSSVNSSGDQKQRLYEMSKDTLGKLIHILEDYEEGPNN